MAGRMGTMGTALAAAGVLVLGLSACSGTERAAQPKPAQASQLTVRNARVWGERGDGPVPAFMELHNAGPGPLRITKITAAHALAVDVRDPGELDGPPLDIPASGSVRLDLGGPYLVLNHPSTSYPEGSTEQLRFVLADGSTATAQADVVVLRGQQLVGTGGLAGTPSR